MAHRTTRPEPPDPGGFLPDALGNELILNQQNMRLLILSGEHNRLLIKIKDRIIQLLIQNLDQTGPAFDRELFLYAAEFLSGGMMAVLEHWAADPGEDSLIAITELIQRNAEHIGEYLYRSAPSVLGIIVLCQSKYKGQLPGKVLL